MLLESENLIFDIGMHKGEDLQFYLNRNAKIIAVDADPLMIELVSRKFKSYIENNRLVLINKAISDVENSELKFNLSSNSEWSSLNPEIAGRSVLNSLAIGIEGKAFSEVGQIKVYSTTLPALMKQYGVPYYCKIDIEGMDNVCLQSLKNCKELPAFISVESECLGENQIVKEEYTLQTLYSLASLGYSKFALIDQKTLQPLRLNEKFYKSSPLFYYLNRVFNRLKLKIDSFTFRDELAFEFNYTFPSGSSGPYGKYLNATWYNFEDAKQLLLQHRTDYFKTKIAEPYGFWCDWHATEII